MLDKEIAYALEIEERLLKLEKVSHTPVDWEPYIKRIEELEKDVKHLKNDPKNIVFGQQEDGEHDPCYG